MEAIKKDEFPLAIQRHVEKGRSFRRQLTASVEMLDVFANYRGYVESIKTTQLTACCLYRAWQDIDLALLNKNSTQSELASILKLRKSIIVQTETFIQDVLDFIDNQRVS